MEKRERETTAAERLTAALEEFTAELKATRKADYRFTDQVRGLRQAVRRHDISLKRTCRALEKTRRALVERANRDGKTGQR